MVILGLGSNIGDRTGYLRAAVGRLSAVVRDMRASTILESAAMLLPDAPPDSDYPYLNMVVSGSTACTPQELFAEVKSIERELGRVQRYVWGPREIDIDILAMDDLVLESPELVIPHSGMLKRDFVMIPLAEVAPDWTCPVQGEYYGMSAGDIIAAEGYCLSDKLTSTGLRINE